MVGANGNVELTFSHRYSFEAGLWDAGAVFVSINGALFAQLGDSAFSQNGYTGFGLIGNHDLNGGEGFNGDSSGYLSGDFITSIALLGNLNAGDTIALQFLGAWDEFAKGSEPNWQIDWVQVTDAAAVPEPGILALFVFGLAGIGVARRKKQA